MAARPCGVRATAVPPLRAEAERRVEFTVSLAREVVGVCIDRERLDGASTVAAGRPVGVISCCRRELSMMLGVGVGLSLAPGFRGEGMVERKPGKYTGPGKS